MIMNKFNYKILKRQKSILAKRDHLFTLYIKTAMDQPYEIFKGLKCL